MPFYEYECPSCRHVAEVMQKISDAPLKKCPSCGKAGIRRLISAPVFRLKGSGWYETDFKSDKEGKRNLAGGDKDDTKPTDAAKPDGAGSGATPATATAAVPAASSEPTKADKPASARRPTGAEPKAKARPVKAAPARRASSAKAPARRK
jgi:putative FmdB family regulatory protein